jgi:hypothetical protein
MVGNTIEYNFPQSLETELFKFYFTSLRNVDRNINHVDINITDGRYNRNITSTTYIVQFISMGKVVEEISIICRYRTRDNAVEIKLVKHILGNELPTDKAIDVYNARHIGFPRYPFICKNNVRLSFYRIENKDFLIKLTEDKKNKPYTLNIGMLNINNTDNRVSVEAIVKCIVKTTDGISKDKIKKLKFTLKAPIMNNGTIKTELTNQYRIAMCYDKEKNIIHFFDIGIVRIKFKDLRSYVYSLTSSPKTRMSVTNTNQSYLFNNYHSVY